MSCGSDEMLWDILEEITTDANDTERAVAIIKHKLRQKLPADARLLTPHRLQELVGRVITPVNKYAQLHRDCQAQLWTYITTAGTMRGSLLPSPFAAMEPFSCTTFQSLVESGAAYPMRWAICRMVLGLESQWWWLPSALSKAQADELLWDLGTRYPFHADAWLRNCHSDHGVYVHALLGQGTVCVKHSVPWDGELQKHVCFHGTHSNLAQIVVNILSFVLPQTLAACNLTFLFTLTH